MPSKGKSAPRRAAKNKKASNPTDPVAQLAASMGIDEDDPIMGNLREMVQDGEDIEMSLAGQCPKCGGTGGEEMAGRWFTCAWCRGNNETPGFR